MLDEHYWFGGFVFNFKRLLGTKKSTIVELTLQENIKEKASSMNISKEISTYLIKVILKSDDDPSVIFHSMDTIIQNFLIKWEIPPKRDIVRKYSDPPDVVFKIPTICSVCGVLVSINDKLKMCENCTSKSFLGTHFLILNTIANTPYGRIFKANHKQSNIIVAIKERTIESDVSNKYTRKEIEKYKYLEGNLLFLLFLFILLFYILIFLFLFYFSEKIPYLTTNRLISVMDDDLRNIKNRYLILEWVNGGGMVGFRSGVLQQTSFKTEKDFVRMFLILLNEIKKLHKGGLVHTDIKTGKNNSVFC